MRRVAAQSRWLQRRLSLVKLHALEQRKVVGLAELLLLIPQGEICPQWLVAWDHAPSILPQMRSQRAIGLPGVFRAAQVVVSLIVGEQDDEVWLRRLRRITPEQRGQRS